MVRWQWRLDSYNQPCHVPTHPQGALHVSHALAGVCVHREFFIAGEPTEQMSDAGEIAVAGEVALSPQAAAALLAALGMPADTLLPLAIIFVVLIFLALKSLIDIP